MSFFEKNKEALLKRDARLAEYINATKPIPVKETKDKANGMMKFISLGKQGVVLLLGFGLGHGAMSVLKEMKTGHRLIVYEPDPGKFVEAMKKHDIRRIISSESVTLIIGEVIDFTFVYAFHERMVNGHLWVITNKAIDYNAEDVQKIDNFRKRFVEEKRFWDTNIGTSLNIGKRFTDAILENIPTIVEKAGISSIFGQFPIPTLIVSTGPSLEKSIEDIKKCQSSLLIIAIDTSAKYLLDNGIAPHFVCGIDPLDDNDALFDDRVRKLPFICMAQYTPNVLKKHEGPVYISGMPGNPIYNYLQWFWDNKGAVDCFGGSVSHFALSIAEALGSQRICMVGQDLSFTSKIHAGTVTKDLHDHQGKEVPDETIGALTATNNRGETVCTKSTFLSFKTAFENKIRSTPHIKFYNATIGGLPIEGTEDITLEDFNRLYGIRSLEVYHNAVSERTRNIQALIDRLKETIRIFRRIKRASVVILKYVRRCKELRMKGNNNDEVRKCVKRIEALRPQTQNPLLVLVAQYHYLLELWLRRQEIQDIDQIKFKWKRFDLQLDRGLNFYGELAEGTGLLTDKLVTLKATLEEKYGNGLTSESKPGDSENIAAACVS